MPFENVEEVAEERTQEAANKRLADGWTLLAVVPGFDQGCAYTSFVLGKVVSNGEKAARMVRERHAQNTLPSIPSRDELQGALRDATQEDILALSELAVWMQQYQNVLVAGRASGIRIGASQEVSDYMLQCLGEDAGTVVGNLTILPAESK
jgi:hypothetical protein